MGGGGFGVSGCAVDVWIRRLAWLREMNEQGYYRVMSRGTLLLEA